MTIQSHNGNLLPGKFSCSVVSLFQAFRSWGRRQRDVTRNSVNSAVCQPLLDWQLLTPQTRVGLLADKVGGITVWKLISQAFSLLYLSSSLLFPALLLSRTPPTERLQQATQLSARFLWKVGKRKASLAPWSCELQWGPGLTEPWRSQKFYWLKSEESGNTYFWSSFLECPGSKGT